MNTATVVLPATLLTHVGGNATTTVNARTVADALHALEAQRPGIRRYLCNDQGTLRPHVNIFVDSAAIRDRARLTDPLAAGATLRIVQAMSGG